MAGLGGLAIGAGLAQGLGGFGKSYLDVVNSYEDNALKREQIAISREAAAMKKQEYEEGLKPVKVSEFSRGMAPEMWQPIYETAKNMGIVKGQGQDEYFHKRDLQEFGENLKKNSIAKAQLLTKSMSLLDQERGGLQQQAQAIGGRIKEFEESWKFRMQQLQKDAGEKGEPINFPKKAALEKEMKEFESQGLYQQYEQLAKTVAGITDKHFRVQHQLGILDDIYKKDAEKYGKEVALRIHSNMMSREQAEQYLIRQRKEEEVRAVAMKKQIELPYDIEEAKIKGDIALRNKFKEIDYKKKQGVGAGAEEKPMKEKEVVSKLMQIDKTLGSIGSKGSNLVDVLLAARGILPEGVNPQTAEELKQSLGKYRDYYMGKLKPEARKLFEKSSAGELSQEDAFNKAVGYLKAAKSKDEARSMISKLKAAGWSREQAQEILEKSGIKY